MSTIENLFLTVIKKVKADNWCIKPGCATCGCMDFRDYVQSLGYEKVIQALYDLSVTDFYRNIECWYNPLKIILYDIGMRNFKDEYPAVIREVFRVEEEKFRQKEERRKKNLEQDTQNHEQAEIILKTKKELYLKSREKAIMDRKRIIEKFSSLDLDGRLRMIACDTNHLPDYFPIDFTILTSRDFQRVSKDTIQLLINSLSKYKKKEWVDFREQLLSML